MDPVIGGTVGAGLLAALMAVSRRQNHARHRALRQAAEDCGVLLEESKPFLFHYGGLRGRVGGREKLVVAIDPDRGGLKMVVGGLQVLGDLRLSPESVASQVQDLMGIRDLATGDAAFDRVVRVFGYAPLALAWLDAETRSCLMPVFGGRIPAGRNLPVGVRALLTRGRLEVHIQEDGTHVNRLRAALHAVLAVASRMHAPRPLPPTLAANARNDPVPGARLANLRALLREFPDDMATREARLRACADADEEVALLAAVNSKQEGRETLLRLAHEAEGDATAAAAIAALGSSLPGEELFLLFKQSREQRRTGKTVACLDALLAHPQAAAFPQMEKLLIDDLKSREDALRVAAVRALGWWGTTVAVVPLQEAGEGHGGNLRAAARQAIAEIQSRLHGATPGQVSLSGGETGQVSLAEDERGRLSIDKE